MPPSSDCMRCMGVGECRACECALVCVHMAVRMIEWVRMRGQDNYVAKVGIGFRLERLSRGRAGRNRAGLGETMDLCLVLGLVLAREAEPGLRHVNLNVEYCRCLGRRVAKLAQFHL